MTAPTLTDFLAAPGTALSDGPLAMIFAEDETAGDHQKTKRNHENERGGEQEHDPNYENLSPRNDFR